MDRYAPHKNISEKYRYFSLALTLFLVLNSLTMEGVSVGNIDNNASIGFSVTFSQPKLSNVIVNDQEFTSIEIKDCISTGEIGEPTLPVYTAKVVIPFDSEIESIDVSNSDFKLIDYDLTDKPIMPQQEQLSFSKKSNKDNFILDEKIYSSKVSISDEIYSLGDTGLCRGYKILTIFLHPVKYLPAEGLICYTNKISVTIDLKDEQTFSDNGKNSFYRSLNSDKKFIETLVENPDDVDSYAESEQVTMGSSPIEYADEICDPEDSYAFVIITNDALKNAAGFAYNWTDLITHRQSYSSLSGTIVTVEEIDACSNYWNDSSVFNDTQAHIREFCKDAYQDWETEYVLLGGDWDATPSHQIVPYRSFTDTQETEEYDNMACDMYYSHLDGDWYDVNDAVWGGGKGSGVNDLYAELFIGRITAHDAETVSNAIYKIINYDTNISLDNSWLRSAAFWGGNLGWPATSKEYMEELRLGTDTYRTFAGFEEWNDAKPSCEIDTSEQLYHEDLGSSYKTYFHNSVEDDAASIINHLDHTTWATPLGMNEWDTRYNTRPFLAASQGCLSGRFQEGASACEQLMCEYQDRHAYALILNTGYGYGASSNTNGATQYIMSYFWDYFFNNQSENPENWQLGKAMSYTRDKIASTVETLSHAWCYSWYSIHLFGDPAQTLRLNEIINDPVEITTESPVNNSLNVQLNTESLDVLISDPDGDLFGYSIETIPNIGSAYGYDEPDGLKTCYVSNLTYNTTYVWFVNATDGYSSTNKTFAFTTRTTYNPIPPEDFTATSINRTKILLSWNQANLDYSYIETAMSSQSWTRGQGTEIYNGISSNFSHSNLDFDTTYYYQIWSWNITDNVWSSSYNSCSNTTLSNNVPVIGEPTPSNGSNNQNLSLNWSIFISDAEDVFDCSIECSNGDSISLSTETDGIKYLPVDDLSYETVYHIWVNVTDGYDTVKEQYSFSTLSPPVINGLPVVSSPSPSNSATGVSISTSQISVLIMDPDYDLLNWTISTTPNIGASNALNDNNGTKTCSISGLSYSTTYQWTVNVYDGTNWSNQTYSFTTQGRPSSNNGGSSPSSSSYTPNTNPVADAGGPYSGTVNETLTFTASDSTDPDGSISSYKWNFGDGSAGSGETVTHSYVLPDVYTVTLTVKDNENGENTDTTTATIVEIVEEELQSISNESDSENETDEIAYNTDFDNDGIPDGVEDQIGSNKNDKSGVEQISVSGYNCFLVDTDNDGIMDVFLDLENNVQTSLLNNDGYYLIDSDGDGLWNCRYSIQNQAFSIITNIKLKQQTALSSFDYYVILIGICLAAFTVAFLYRRKKIVSSKKYSVPKHYRTPGLTQKPSVNFFSKTEESWRQPTSPVRLDTRFKEVQKVHASDYNSKAYDAAPNLYSGSVNEKDDFLAEIRDNVDELKTSRKTTRVGNIDSIVDDIIFDRLKD